MKTFGESSSMAICEVRSSSVGDGVAGFGLSIASMVRVKRAKADHEACSSRSSESNVTYIFHNICHLWVTPWARMTIGRGMWLRPPGRAANQVPSRRWMNNQAVFQVHDSPAEPYQHVRGGLGHTRSIALRGEVN